MTTLSFATREYLLMSDVLAFVTAHAVDLFAVLGAASVLAGLVARLTPNKTDDAVVAKVQAALESLGSLFLKPASKK
jgi:hypothetical protein